MDEISDLYSLEKKPQKPVNKGGNWYKGMPSPALAKKYGGFQNPQERAKTLCDEYTPAQIVEFAKKIRDGKSTPLTTPDAIIVVHLANIFSADGLERERLYDRTFGKVPERIMTLNINLDVAPEQLQDSALAILNKLTE